MARLADMLDASVMGRGHGIEYTTKLYTAEGGQILDISGTGWGVTLLNGSENQGYGSCDFVLNSPSGSEWGLDFRDVKRQLDLIDKVTISNYRTEGAYRSIKESLIWKRLYRVGNYSMLRVSSDGTSTTGDLLSCPCYNCGFLTSMLNIEIDHHKPLVGGGDQAILKVFRHFELTESGPVGQLGQRNIHNIANIEDLTPLNPKGRDPGDWIIYGNTDNDNVRARYELNPYGILILSVALKLTDLEDLRARCLNNFFNLRPLCSACNNIKSNKIKTI